MKGSTEEKPVEIIARDAVDQRVNIMLIPPHDGAVTGFLNTHVSLTQVTPCSAVLIKSTVSKIVKTSFAFYGTSKFIYLAQRPATGPNVSQINAVHTV
jgi:hypothetical protein